MYYKTRIYDGYYKIFMIIRIQCATLCTQSLYNLYKCVSNTQISMSTFFWGGFLHFW